MEPRTVPRDLKLLCRLISLHDKRDMIAGTVTLYVGTKSEDFELRGLVDIGRSIKCLIFKRSVSDSQVETILAFNWFAPTGITDYVTLGWSLISQSINTTDGLLSDFATDAAAQFGTNGLVESEIKNLSANDTITITGFSMGGVVSHGMANHLVQRFDISPARIKVISFGSSRPGSKLLHESFEKFNAESMNVVLINRTVSGTEFDPVARMPSTSKGFDCHPNLHLLFNGKIHRISDVEKETLLENPEDVDTEGSNVLFNCLFRLSPFSGVFKERYKQMHSILTYYEQMQ